MEKPAKDTVIIVHGTWAAPEPGKSRWYQPIDGVPAAEGFVGKLDAALQKLGSPARCWAHCTQGNPIFQWSGENSWIARTRAAAALGGYVAKLQKEGWRCHIVAHSHGGNVVAEALPQMLAAPNGRLGKVVTLGTPFMDTISPIFNRAERRAKVLNFASWTAVIGLMLFLLLVSVGQLVEHFRSSNNSTENLVTNYFLDWTHDLSIVGLLALTLGLIFRRYDHQKKNMVSFRPSQPSFLAIGSPVDEAWQVLHHLRVVSNPLAVTSNMFSYLFSLLRSEMTLNAESARMRGAKSFRDLGLIGKLAASVLHVFFHLMLFAVAVAVGSSIFGVLPDQAAPLMTPTTYGLMGVAVGAGAYFLVLALSKIFGETFHSAFWSPYRRYARWLGSVRWLVRGTVTYIVRHKSWSVLQAIAMGLDGYGHLIPAIEQHPSNIPHDLGKYEDMPKSAERSALERRSAWVARHLGDVSQTFSKLAITAADVTSLLRTVEADQTLVHAAYYTDDACIARIADWIAGKG